MPFNSNSFVPQEIVQVGAGGTGSRMADEARYFIRGNWQEIGSAWHTIVDYDSLSESNLQRQLYFKHEVGDLTKGQILTNRYRDLVRMRQIPEPINADTISRIFNSERLSRKLLIFCCADNGLVVKQVIEYMLNNAQNDYLIVYMGSKLVSRDIDGAQCDVGTGQAWAYGQLNGQPLYPATPYETLPDVMRLEGFGPTPTGQNCGVDDTSGAQTPLMNDSCVVYAMTIVNLFFEHGVFMPAIYFTNGVETIYGDPINLATLNSRQVVTSVEVNVPQAPEEEMLDEGPAPAGVNDDIQEMIDELAGEENSLMDNTAGAVEVTVSNAETVPF